MSEMMFAFSSNSQHDIIQTTSTANKIVKEGYLEKQSVHLKKLRRRWIVLRDNKKLYSYKHKETNVSKMTEIIDLNECRNVIILNDNKNKEQYFQFVLIFDDKRRIFVADSVNDANNWVQHIAQQISNTLNEEECKTDLFCSRLLEQHYTCWDKNNVKACVPISRITFMLHLFYKNDNDNKSDMIKLINNDYSIIHLLNDYIHILHSHQESFALIHNVLGFGCSLQKCNSFKRNIGISINIPNSEGINVHDTVTTNIIDQIHCYFLHTFDVGFRLKSTKLINENRNNDITFSNKYFICVQKHLKNRENVLLNNSKTRLSKFVTSVKTENKCNDNDAKNDHDENPSVNAYSFSYRFYYWKCYENCYEIVPHIRHLVAVTKKMDNYGYDKAYKFSDLYVPPKYKNLMQELLHNNIYSIDAYKWNIIQQKANQYLHTNNVKQLRSKKHWSLDYQIDDGTQICIHHLITVISYCDYDELCFKYGETFRHNKSDKNNLKVLIQRHSNYHWLAKYMRETMVFPSTVAYFNNPTSTTDQLIVAANFATHNGIIITLTGCAKCFDCGWLSKYTNENEFLFMGGLHSLTITNIIECSNGKQYSMFLSLLNKLVNVLNGERIYEDCSRFEISLLNSLCSNTDIKSNNSVSIPQYVLDIFNQYTVSKKFVNIDVGKLKRS
eukprot:244379_1